MLCTWLGGNYHYQAKHGHIILKHHKFFSSVCVFLWVCFKCEMYVCVHAVTRFLPHLNTRYVYVCVHSSTENSIWQGQLCRKWSIEQQLYSAAKDSLLDSCLFYGALRKNRWAHTQTQTHLLACVHTDIDTCTHAHKRACGREDKERVWEQEWRRCD